METFLRENRAEVLGMLLEEFDAEKYERTLKEEGIEYGIEYGLQATIEIMQEMGQTREKAIDKLMEKFSLSEQEAGEKLDLYWKK